MHSRRPRARLLAAVAVALAPAAGSAPRSDLDLAAHPTERSTVLPTGGIDLVLTLSNASSQAVDGVAYLDPADGDHVRLHVVSTSGSVTTVHHHRRTTPNCNLSDWRTVWAGTREEVVLHVGYDWSAKRFLFDAPGAYEVWISLPLEDGRALESNRVTVEVLEPTESEAAEIARFRELAAWPLVHAPHATCMPEGRNGRIRELVDAVRARPTSPWLADAAFLEARWLEYELLASNSADPTTRQRTLTRMRELLREVVDLDSRHRPEAEALLALYATWPPR